MLFPKMFSNCLNVLNVLFFFGIIDYQVACVSIVSIVGIVSVVLGTMVLFGRDLGFMERYSCNPFYFHFIVGALLKKTSEINA